MFFRLLIFVIIISFACSQSGDEDSIENSDNAPNPTNYCERIYNDVKNQIKRKKKAETKAGGKKKSGVDRDAVRNFAFQQIEANLDNDYDAMLDSAVDFLLTLSSAAPIPFAGEISKVLAFAWKLFRKKDIKAKKEVSISEQIAEALVEQSSDNWKLKLDVLKDEINEVIESSCKYFNNRSAPFSATETYETIKNIKIAEFAKSLDRTYCKDSKDIDGKKIQRCLLLANMYADVQILRQIAIACYNLVISLPDETAEKRELNLPQVALEEETNGESTREALLKDKLKKILENDFKELSFLQRVMNMIPGGHRLHIFAKLYSSPIQYQSLTSYLEVLWKNRGETLTTIVFAQRGLKSRVPIREPANSVLPDGAKEIFSIFVAPKKKAFLHHMKNLKGSWTGPIYGPAMFEEIRYPGIWESILVMKTTKDARKMVRICGKVDLQGECTNFLIGEYNLRDTNPRGFNTFSAFWDNKKFICQQENGRRNKCERDGIPVVDDWRRPYHDCLNEFHCSINGSSSNWDCFRGMDWTWRVRSMVVPRGLTVKVFQDSRAIRKEHLINMRGWYGPYTGPQVAAELPPFAFKLKIERTDSSKLQIRLCTKPNLRGECGEVTIDQRKIKQTGKQIIDVTQGINKIPFHMRRPFEEPWDRMGYNPDNTQLRSMFIPDGYQVITSTGEKGGNNPRPDRLHGYNADISVEESGRKLFRLEVQEQFNFKAANEKEDSNF